MQKYLSTSFALLLFCFSLALLTPTHLSAADSDAWRGITATGSCLKKVSQDRASVVLTTSILAPDASTASKQATRDSQKVRDAILALKLDGATLETTGFSVGEERFYENKKWVSKGFRARVGLSVETSNIPRIGEAISAAAKLGVKEVDSLNTFVSAEKYKREYESCLEVAAKNARDKAGKLSDGAGVKLGKVLRVEEGSRPAPRPMYRAEKSMMMADAEAGAAPASAPMIDARAEDMTVTATVTFAAD